MDNENNQYIKFREDYVSSSITAGPVIGLV